MQDGNGISVALLRPLADLLTRLDADAVAFLQTVEVTEDLPPTYYCDARVVDAALAALATKRRDPAFALTLAHADLARPLGLFGHLVWLSGSVRDALQRAAKFYALVSQRSVVTLDESRDGVATLTQAQRSEALVRGHILTEFAFASMAMRARAATNQAFTLRAVRFTHPGRTTHAYRQAFGVTVQFGASQNQLEMATSQLDLRLNSADAITSAALEAQASQLTQSLHETASNGGFLDAARCAINSIMRSQGGVPTPANIAKQLGMSPRTLRRQLEQHGTSLRAQTAQVNCAQANALLDRGVAVKEVAFALGFSEPSAFSRAYKRWTGQAPTAPLRPKR